MSDPIAQAAQQIQHEDKPQSIAGEIMGAMHALEQKVEHFLHPDAPVVAQSGESAASTSQPAADTTAKSSEQQGIGEVTTLTVSPALLVGGSAESAGISPTSAAKLESLLIGGTADSPNAAPAADAQPATQPSVQGVSTDASAAAEHPHTSCLRKIVACLRRDFAMLPGELESWVKTAESHL